MAIKIETYQITTASGSVCRGGMGAGFNPLPFLSESEAEEFDHIGYTGKNAKNEEMGCVEFLNSLDKGAFSMCQIKWDNGDFTEKFIVIRVREVDENKSHIKFCVAYAIANLSNPSDGGMTNKFSSFDDEGDAKAFYDIIKKHERLYTANFCKVIETTE